MILLYIIYIYIKKRPSMTRLEVINWFKKKLNRNPEPNDYYTVNNK